MDPLSILSSTIGILNADDQVYTTVKKIAGLPDAFKEVERQLPIVNQTLRHAKSRLRRGPDPSDEEEAAITAILQPFQNKITKLYGIFDALAKKCGDDSSKAWPKLRAAYRMVLAGKKANRVEDLMKAALEDIKKLALHQVFQMAMEEDVKQLEQALAALAQVAPSMADRDIESGSIQASMTVSNGGKGQQNNVQGDNNTFNSGENVATGQGHTIYFGKDPSK